MIGIAIGAGLAILFAALLVLAKIERERADDAERKASTLEQELELLRSIEADIAAGRAR